MATQFTAAELEGCCASQAWAAYVADQEFESWPELLAAARRAWWHETPITGWLEAFAAHPRLGDAGALTAKSDDASASDFEKQSAAEQSGLHASADKDTVATLVKLNEAYEEAYGHVFLLCAKGRAASDVLASMRQRSGNTPLAELKIAAAQQMLITEQRLRDLASRRGLVVADDAAPVVSAGGDGRPPITCHVLDTATGLPAADLPVMVLRQVPQTSAGDEIWDTVTRTATDADGRTAASIAPGALTPGLYRVTFHASDYYRRAGVAEPFYPRPCVDFTVTDATVGQHFHIPLLLSPFSYSTYRGS